MQNFISILCVFWITAFSVGADQQIVASNELDDAYFCAICELVKTNSDLEIKFAKKFPGIDFFRLRPIKIFWGSLKESEPSLAIHPKPEKEGKSKVLVIFRSEKNLIPGDWTKKYLPIQEPARIASSYLLEGDALITPNDLEQFLEKYSARMLVKYPLDVE